MEAGQKGSFQSKTYSKLPLVNSAKRRKSALTESVTLSTFERAYLEKLRNHERPRVRVQFASDSPPDADFIFHSENVSPSSPKISYPPLFNEFNRRTRGRVPFIDPSESARLERELAVPQYKSYYRDIAKRMKVFDATFISIPESDNKTK